MSANGARPLLDVVHLTQEYRVKERRQPGARGRTGATVHAVTDVSFQIRAGESLGIVGETGCGKSTLARAILQAPPPRSGRVVFDGHELTALKRRELRAARNHLQMVFQDPYSSLDPHWRVKDLVEEPLAVRRVSSRAERQERVDHVLNLVGLDPARYGRRRPRELSGGQCQRVAIARALALSPKLIVCDEVVSALDVSIQAQILNLFERLRSELELSYLFIAHDLAVVKHVSDRIGVMYLGRLCEIGRASDVYQAPTHPYTAALFSAIPTSKRTATAKERIHVAGEPPSPTDPPSGCRFRTRCPRAESRCADEVPELRPVGDHLVACHFPLV